MVVAYKQKGGLAGYPIDAPDKRPGHQGGARDRANKIDWTPEKIQIVKDMRAAGESMTRIAAAVVTTRSGVAGKISRLHLEPMSLERRLAVPRVPKIRVKATPKAAAPRIWDGALVLDDGSHVTGLTVNDHTCRWPIGDPQHEDFHFCGHPPKPGRPYCNHHEEVACDGKATEAYNRAVESRRK